MILRAASWLVPRRARAEWRKEWEGELAFAWQASQTTEEPSAVPRLRWRCCGAFLDAAWCGWNRGESHLGDRWPQKPGFVLIVLAGALLLLAGASGGFPRMRSILLV
jgi:hypothetical protein